MRYFKVRFFKRGKSHDHLSDCKIPNKVSFSLSLSLTHTHTHTYIHAQSSLFCSAALLFAIPMSYYCDLPLLTFYLTHFLPLHSLLQYPVL
jgi:hypothetical protein